MEHDDNTTHPGNVHSRVTDMNFGREFILLDTNAVSVTSLPFLIHAGNVAVVKAYGFPGYADRPDKNTTRTLAAACLHMLMVECETPVPPDTGCFKPPPVDVTHPLTVIADDEVRINCGCVCISACNNIMIWDTPGLYRFVLNDPSALGLVTIILALYETGQFSVDIRQRYGV